MAFWLIWVKFRIWIGLWKWGRQSRGYGSRLGWCGELAVGDRWRREKRRERAVSMEVAPASYTSAKSAVVIRVREAGKGLGRKEKRVSPNQQHARVGLCGRHTVRGDQRGRFKAPQGAGPRCTRYATGYFSDVPVISSTLWPRRSHPSRLVPFTDGTDLCHSAHPCTPPQSGQFRHSDPLIG